MDIIQLLLLQLLLMFVLGYCTKVAQFVPGTGCGGTYEITTITHPENADNTTLCQLISYTDKSDVIPEQNISK